MCAARVWWCACIRVCERVLPYAQGLELDQAEAQNDMELELNRRHLPCLCLVEHVRPAHTLACIGQRVCSMPPL